MSISTMIANATKNALMAAPTTTTKVADPAIQVLALSSVVKAMNSQAKVSLVTQQLFRKDFGRVESVALATAFIGLEEVLIDGEDDWEDQMIDAIYETEVKAVDGLTTTESWTDFELDGWREVLLSIDLITEDNKAGKFLLQLNEEKAKSYARPATEPVTSKNRRKKVISGGAKLAPLAKKTINYLQRVERVISIPVYTLAVDVFDGWSTSCKEQYVLDGAADQILKGNVPSINEYFLDSRARTYQGDVHGGNVQSGDMARALTSPWGVTLDYDVVAARKVLMAEMADMIKGCSVDDAMVAYNAYTPVEFMRLALTAGTKVNDKVKKPWAFFKAVQLVEAIDRGEKPYLDLTVGLDAKCSGPQLGALMVGDKALAAACGFSNSPVEDAYEMAIVLLKARGFTDLDRGLVKKPYMGIFYGQGFKAFADPSNYALQGAEPKKNQHEYELLGAVMSLGGDSLEANAIIFHGIIEKSFGKKLGGLRTAIKAMHFHYEGEKGNKVRVDHCDTPTSYFLPDGQQVTADYRMVLDIFGNKKGQKEPCADIVVESGFLTLKFNDIKFKTEEYDFGAYGRNGFVNFIQSVDGLLARLIISKLEDLGATHCDPVHDCFRVTIPDMIDGKLHNAIKFAYNSLFGYETDHKTLELPHGTDALKMYAEGVNRALMPEYKFGTSELTKKYSQFKYSPTTKAWRRNIAKSGLNIQELVGNMSNDLEDKKGTYFFAK